MESTVRLYSPKIGEIFKFLNSFFYNYEENTKIESYENSEKFNSPKAFSGSKSLIKDKQGSYSNNNFNKSKNKLTNVNKRTLEWEINFRNPLEIADILGALIENNDKFNINMWVSIDEGLFINVTDYNADEIIRYLYERFPW